MKQGLVDGEVFERAVGLAIQAILCSPDFLYLIETGENGAGSSTATATATVPPLSHHELAARLSYFLWSAPPDEVLDTLADQHHCRDGAQLKAQVERMLRDKRAQALMDGFAAQWCELSKIGSFDPDPNLYPNYDKTLELAIAGETTAFVHEILDHDLDVRNFLSADWAMLNERTARHYGVPGITGDAFRRVTLAKDSPRGGLVTQASMLMLTSDGIRSRPVHRGVWILRNILGTPPRPPPPNAGELPNIPGFDQLSLRQQIEKHRALETCAACHAKIDALGFALEHFDAVGSWRDEERRPLGDYNSGKFHAFPISDASPWADGTEVAGISGLHELLLSHEAQFRKSLLTKLFIYGAGHAPGLDDDHDLTEILRPCVGKPLGLRTLLTALISAPVFQRR